MIKGNLYRIFAWRLSLSLSLLPLFLSKIYVICLRLQIYVVGTAHISKKSVEDVRNTIELVKPDTVLVCVLSSEGLVSHGRVCDAV